MSRISRLPPDLANQIAAGEVVERPASVVKELVENAIDAEARRITIEIELGGKRLIRVEDDGLGMEPADAALALERHATSKIRRAEDLTAIRTLGFRGEALPSIASVSHLRLATRARGRPSGTEVRIDAGVVTAVREIGTAEGTTAEVRDLFYNLPARRKFLKADAAESAQVSRTITQLALGYPERGFTLISAGRRVLQVAPVETLRERFYQIYGERPDLVEVDRRASGIRLEGFVAALTDQGPSRGAQNIFVNRRIVRDKTIAHAIATAYSVATIKERRPEVHVFIDVPPDRVDVNVHPTKAEVRFLEPSFVHEVLRRALANALGTDSAPALHFQVEALRGRRDEAVPVPAASRVLPGVLGGETVARASVTLPTEPTPRDAALSGSTASRPSADAGADASADSPVSASAGLSPPAVARQAAVDGVRPMTPLGQFRQTYIIAVDAEGLCIVDQHVAHERILFEQVMERLTAGALPSQRLLQPLLIDMAPAQRDALRAHAEDLVRLGFEVEEFGGSTVRVAAVPAMLRLDEAATAVCALAEDLEGFDRGARIEDALRRLAATTACHAAVKANQSLTQEKMAHLLDELRRTAYSTVCPHGRPVVLRLTRREIEKNFQRI